MQPWRGRRSFTRRRGRIDARKSSVQFPHGLVDWNRRRAAARFMLPVKVIALIFLDFIELDDATE
jgi:hypothetical protein